MAIISVTGRKVGADDISFGIGAYTYTDVNGITSTIPQVNATQIPISTGAMVDTVVGAWITMRSSDTAAAVAAIGSRTATLYFPPGSYPITANTTVPSNITLRMEDGASFLISNAKTLTINGAFECGLYRCFSWIGTGKVVFGAGAAPIYYPQWWGAVTGITNDCSAAYAAAIAAIPTGAVLRTTDGIWRLASALITTKVIAWRGNGAGSKIYLDVGVINDGITFGDTTNRSGLEITGLYIVGPASSCKDALVLNNMHNNRIDVQICTGAVGYGAHIVGCVYNTHRIRCKSNGDYNFRPANGIKYEWSSVPNQCNRTKLYIEAESQTGVALYIGDGNQEVINVSGSIEYATGTYALYAKNVYSLNVHDLFGTDGNTGKFHYEGCQQLKLNEVHSYGVTTELVGCSNSSIDASNFGILSIDATSLDTTIGNIALGGSLGGAGELQDAGQNTTYTGGVKILSIANAPLANKRGNDQQNVITNANLERWQSDRPDGWGKSANTTWTKCGDGLADTTRRGTRYCAKSVVNAFTGNTFSLDADVKKQCLGNQISFSAWIHHASGQTPSSYPYVELQVFDGVAKSVTTYAPSPLSASTDDAWSKINVSCFVPLTATNIYITLYQYVPAGGGTNTLYLSEPCLFIGANPPSSYAASRPQGTLIEVAGYRVDYGTAVPTTGWHSVGDVRINTIGAAPKFWACVTSGTPGTWTACSGGPAGITSTGSGTVTVTPIFNGMIYVATGTVTYSLPTGDLSAYVSTSMPGLTYTFCKTAANTVTIDPGAGNFLEIGGAGVATENNTAGETGSTFTVQLIKSAASVNTWICTKYRGTWHT